MDKERLTSIQDRHREFSYSLAEATSEIDAHGASDPVSSRNALTRIVLRGTALFSLKEAVIYRPLKAALSSDEIISSQRAFDALNNLSAKYPTPSKIRIAGEQFKIDAHIVFSGITASIDSEENVVFPRLATGDSL